ncbi:MAG: hypothetical protein V4508_13160 [Pseudomonadota bacterium]
MINFVRTACIVPGKLGEAIHFAKEINEHFARTYDIKLTVQMPVAGNPHRISWLGSYPTLAALEEVQLKLVADQKFAAIVAAGANNFIAGSINDDIWRTL